MTLPTEVHVPAVLLERILQLAGTEMILVGGRALAFWAAYYHTSAPTIAITKDVGDITTEAITARAVLAESPAGRFRVMHYNHPGRWVCDADGDRCHYEYTGHKWNPVHWEDEHRDDR